MAPPRKDRPPIRACDRCGEVSDNFQGRNGVCRPCVATRDRARRAADPERARAKDRAVHARHREAERLAQQARRASDPEKAREISNRAYHNRRARDPEAVRANQRAASARFRARHPEKVRADIDRRNASDRFKEARRVKGIVQNAIKTGRLTRPTTCEQCGSDGLIEAAHFDYSQPLMVRWLCRRCHRQWDAAQPKTRKG